MLYISNTFSASMLDRQTMMSGIGVARTFTPLKVEQAIRILNDAERQGVEIQSIVGHEDTAALFAFLLCRKISVNRVSITLREPCDWQEKTLIYYKGARLNNGKTPRIIVRGNEYLFTTEHSDRLIFGQYVGPRLPEGAKTLPPGATIEWWWY